MQAKDKMFEVTGWLKITKWFGQPFRSQGVVLFDGPNLVVNLSRVTMRKFMYSSNAGIFLSKMKIGGAVTDPGAPATAPTVNDTQLVSVINPIPIDGGGNLGDHMNVSATEIPTYDLKFTATLEDNQGNGWWINEEGLFTEDDILIARVVFNPIEKTDNWALTFEHTLQF